MTTPDAERSVVISIRPRFARAILDGHKSVELRRHRVAAPAGSLLILYAAAPVMAVLGTVRLTDVDTGSATTIWRLYGDRLGLSEQEFASYLDGATQASALALARPHTLPVPLTLAALRASSPFQPPQSYRYLSADDPRQLRTLANDEHPARALWRRLETGRLRRGWTFHDLAERTGVSASRLHYWAGRRQTAPAYHELMAIIDSLGEIWDDEWARLWQQAVATDNTLF